MGQDLRQVALGEIIFLAGVGLYYLFLLFSIWYIRAPLDPLGFHQFCPLCWVNALWLIGLTLGLLIPLYGAWKMLVSGTLGGVHEQSREVLAAGGLIITIGVILFLAPVILLPPFMPAMLEIHMVNPIYLGSVSFCGLQLILGAAIIGLTIPKYLEARNRPPKEKESRVESFRDLVQDSE